MPEFPDIVLYLESLRTRIVERTLHRVRFFSPFVLRSIDPPPSRVEGQVVRGLRRIGKQIVWEFDGPVFLVIHLMIAGRFHWKKAGAQVSRKVGLAAFDFDDGTLLLTEASTKKRASIHLVGGEDALRSFSKGGIEVFDATLEAFSTVLRSENHTLKRSLTDPRLFSGIGNAYSDEILHRAKLSPLIRTSRLSDEEVRRLFTCVTTVLREWSDRLITETGAQFPEKVTAFRPEMAVHGKFRKPCPVCGTPVQRIVYAENECNYCPTCQTGGKVLADRSLSRLLKEDWPKTADEL